MKPHTNLLKAIMASAPANVRLFQNDQGSVELIDGRHITYGLLTGSSDLIGWTVIRGIAVFTGVEAKIGSDKVRPAQAQWRFQVTSQGGIAIVARSVEECWQLHTAATNKLLASFNSISP